MPALSGQPAGRQGGTRARRLVRFSSCYYRPTILWPLGAAGAPQSPNPAPAQTSAPCSAAPLPGVKGTSAPRPICKQPRLPRGPERPQAFHSTHTHTYLPCTLRREAAMVSCQFEIRVRWEEGKRSAQGASPVRSAPRRTTREASAASLDGSRNLMNEGAGAGAVRRKRGAARNRCGACNSITNRSRAGPPFERAINRVQRDMCCRRASRRGPPRSGSAAAGSTGGGGKTNAPARRHAGRGGSFAYTTQNDPVG